MVKTNTWVTKWGTRIQGQYREGKSDWNTHQAIIKEDEYYFNELPKGTVGVDIGGFIGSASLAMASLGMTVYCVEALPENVEMINANLALNGYQEKVQVYHRAIGGNDSDTIDIYYGDPGTAGGKVHEFIGHARKGVDAEKSTQVVSLSLDTLLQAVPHVDILKIDCEGGEWPAFENASLDTIKKMKWIAGELHGGPERKTIKDFLKLFNGEFEDVSTQFGCKVKPESNIHSFVFRNKK